MRARTSSSSRFLGLNGSNRMAVNPLAVAVAATPVSLCRSSSEHYGVRFWTARPPRPTATDRVRASQPARLPD